MNGLITDGASKLTRTQLAAIPTPPGTDTHHPVPHIEVVETLLQTLAFRHINIVSDEYAVSHDGMKLFGFAELEMPFDGCRFALGIRNSHDKSMRLGLTVGFRVLVCMNMAFAGDFTPVNAKHSKHFNLLDAISVGVDKMQRNFEPMARQVTAWKQEQITDDYARLVLCKAFFEEKLSDVPKHLARDIYSNYFNPTIPDFEPRTKWSLQNAFTSSFKHLDPIPQFRATASLGEFFS
jgi:hypothetical protein